MRRREFITLLGGAVTAAVAWPLAAYAHQAVKVPLLGYLSLRASPSADDEAFKQGLRELGWIEGQNIAIEYRWAAGQTDRLATLAAELVRLQVDCIAVAGTPVAQAAKAAADDSHCYGVGGRSSEDGLGRQPRTTGGQHDGDDLHRSGAGGQSTWSCSELCCRDSLAWLS